MTVSSNDSYNPLLNKENMSKGVSFKKLHRSIDSKIYFAAKYFSASNAAIQPVPAAVIACL